MSKLTALIKKVAELDPVTSRKVSCMVGAAIGDACCVRLEWIYNQDVLNKIVGQEDPVFWKDSHGPYYVLPNGKISGYGDQSVQTLQAMADNDGTFDEMKLMEHYCNYFGDPKGPYQKSLAKRAEGNFPVEGPWIQKAVIKMMDNFRNGKFPPGAKDAYEHDGIVAFLPLVVQQSPNLDYEKLQSAFKLSTQFPFSIGHHLVEAELISKFIQGSKDPIADIKERFYDTMVYQEILTVERGLSEGMDAKVMVRKCGMACELPGSFMSSLVVIKRANSFAEGIRENIHCAGALCARANFIGACLGAKFGIQGIPQEWLMRVEGIDNIIENSLKCFS